MSEIENELLEVLEALIPYCDPFWLPDDIIGTAEKIITKAKEQSKC